MSALSGVKVLELAESVSGEYCGKLLTDFGAQVIKLEKPGKGSPTRYLGPFSNDIRDEENSGLFAYLNTDKYSVELDLDCAESQPTFLSLLAQVDVVIDDHNASFLASLGLNRSCAEKQHPNLIICSITNYGLEPPADRKHSEDINVFHNSGWGYHTPSGADPAFAPLNGAGRFLPSYEAGLEAALCISSALYEKADSGLGNFIEISKQEVLASRIDYVLAQMISGDMNVGTDRTAFDLGGPAGIFPCEDGYVYIWLSTVSHWEGLRQLLDNPEWMANFPNNWLEKECTPERVSLCRQQITEWLTTQNKHTASEQAQKLGVTLVAVNNAQDLIRSPQYQHRQFFVELNHPHMGKSVYPGVPYLLSKTPARPRTPAPLLGQHNTELLTEKLSNALEVTE